MCQTQCNLTLGLEEHPSGAYFAPQADLPAVETVSCLELVGDGDRAPAEERGARRKRRVHARVLRNADPLVELQVTNSTEHQDSVVATRADAAERIEIRALESTVGRCVEIPAGDAE